MIEKSPKKATKLISKYNQKRKIPKEDKAVSVDHKKSSGEIDEIENLRNALDQNEGAIVGSAKSLIDSIKKGKLSLQRRADSSESMSIEPGTSKSDKAKTKKRLDQQQDSHKQDDGIQVGVNTSEDDYIGDETDEDMMSSSSESESETDSEQTSDEISDDQGYSPFDSSQQGEETPSQTRGRASSNRAGNSELPKLDRNDPRVRELLDIMLDEQLQEEREKLDKLRSKLDDSRGKNKTPSNSQRNRKGITVKSPSDTTLYAPALNKKFGTPTGVAINQLNEQVNDSIENVSEIVGNIRISSRERGHKRRRSKERSSSRASSIRDAERISPSHSRDSRYDSPPKVNIKEIYLQLLATTGTTVQNYNKQRIWPTKW